jgi:hypothetical protein
MVDLGIIRMEKKGRTTLFVAQSPDLLLGLAESQKQRVNQAQSALEGILPSLKDTYVMSEERPVVSYYEGLEGVKRVYLDKIVDMSGVDEPILAIVETSKVDPDVYRWVTTDFVKARKKNNIHVKAIVASGQKTKKYLSLDKEELRESKLVDSSRFPFEHEINIYGDKVAIINHRKGEPLMGIIIHNRVIAATFRSWFNLTWDAIS